MKERRTSLSYMIAAARKVWRWTPERKVVLDRCKYFDGFKCEKCGKVSDYIEKIRRGKKVLVMPIQVDHKEPVGKQPSTWLEFGVWLMRLFCSIENLWGICLACHQSKTNNENRTRRVVKKGKSK